MKRILFIILTPLLILSAFTSGVEFLLKPWLNEFVKNKMNHFQSADVPLQFSVQDVQFQFIAPDLTISQIQIEPQGQLKQFLKPMRIEKIHARINPFKLLIGQLNLSVLEIIKPEIELQIDQILQDESPSQDLPIQKIFEMTNFLPIERILIDQAQFKTNSSMQNWNLDLQEFRIILSSQKNLLSAKAEFNKVHFTYKDQRPLEAQMLLNLRMTPKKIVSDFTELKTASFSTQLLGECIQLEKINQSPNCVANIKNNLQLEELNQLLSPFINQLPMLKGSVTSNGKIQIAKNNISGSAEIQTLNVQLNQFKLGNAHVKGNYSNKGLELSELNIQHPAGTAKLLNSIVRFQQQIQFETNVLVQEIDIQKLFTNLNLTEIPVWLKLKSELPCQGSIGEKMTIKCQGQIEANNLKIQSQFHNPESTIVGVEKLIATGELTATNEKIDYQAKIKLGNKSYGQSQGSIDFKEGFDIYFKADYLDFLDIQNLANIDFAGSLKLEGSTQGDSQSAIFKMKLNSQSFNIQKFYLGQLSTDLSYEKGQLYFDNLQGLVGEMGLVGSMALDFNESKIQGKIFSQNAELKHINSIITQFYTLPVDIAGKGALKVQFSGPFDFWKMNLDIDGQFNQASIATENFDQVTAVIKAENGQMNFSNVCLNKNKSTIKVDGHIDQGKDLHLNIKGSNLLLEESQFFNHISEKIFGQLNVFATVGGTISEPLFNLNGQIKQTVIDEQEIEDSNFNIRSNKSKTNIESDLFAGKIQTLIQIPTANSKEALQINIETNDWDYAAFIGLLNANKLANNYKSSLSLSAKLKSDQGLMSDVSGEAKIQQLMLRKANFEIKNETPAFIHFKQGNMTFQHFELKGGDSILKMEGQDFRFDRMNMQVKTKLDLNLVHLFLPFLEDLGGIAEANATIQGRLTQPMIYGNLNLKNAFIKIPGLPHPIEKLNSDITFSQSKILVNSITSQFAGGQLVADGQILINGKEDLPMNIRARLEKVTMNVPDRVRTQGNADLLISGKWFPFVLSGTYDVQSAFIDKEFGGDGSAVQVKQSLFLPKIIKEESFTPLKFDIQVLLNKNIIIKNSILNASINGQLQVKGTTANPVLIGKINTDKGSRLNFKDKSFEIQSGIISFNDETEINPDLFISAQSRVSDYDVNLLIQGLAKNLQFKMSSVPPLSDQEIVSLLALGITSSKLDSSVQSKDQQAQTGYEIGAAIFSNNPLSKKLKETLGINLQLTSSFDSSKNITVPKMTASRQLTEKLSATASRSLGGEEITYDMQINYMINNTLSAVGSWESKESENTTSINTSDENKSSIFGLDLEYKKEFK